MKSESEQIDENIDLVSSNEIELGTKNTAKAPEILPDSKQGDLSLSKPQV